MKADFISNFKIKRVVIKAGNTILPLIIVSLWCGIGFVSSSTVFFFITADFLLLDLKNSTIVVICLQSRLIYCS